MTMLKLRKVMEITSLGRSTIFSYISMGKFPAPIKLGERASAWTSDSIENWLQMRIDLSNNLKSAVKSRIHRSIRRPSKV